MTSCQQTLGQLVDVVLYSPHVGEEEVRYHTGREGRGRGGWGERRMGGETDGGKDGATVMKPPAHTPTSPVAVYLPYPVPHYVGQSLVSAVASSSSTIRLLRHTVMMRKRSHFRRK